jgi:hypothetical protein
MEPGKYQYDAIPARLATEKIIDYPAHFFLSSCVFNPRLPKSIPSETLAVCAVEYIQELVLSDSFLFDPNP